MVWDRKCKYETKERDEHTIKQQSQYLSNLFAVKDVCTSSSQAGVDAFAATFSACFARALSRIKSTVLFGRLWNLAIFAGDQSRSSSRTTKHGSAPRSS